MEPTATTYDIVNNAIQICTIKSNIVDPLANFYDQITEIIFSMTSISLPLQGSNSECDLYTNGPMVCINDLLPEDYTRHHNSI